MNSDIIELKEIEIFDDEEETFDSFYVLYMSGQAILESIDDYIERWHSDEIEKHSKELHEYLGLTQSEYRIFVENHNKFARYMELLRASLASNS